MTNFSFQGIPSTTKFLFPVIMFFLFVPFNSKAQSRNFGFVFSENMHGGTALFGNTLMNAVNADGVTPNLTYMNGNSVNGYSLYDNGGLGTTPTNMQYVDIDGSTGDGAGTRNSSSSDLSLPAGTNTIRLARLYWGGRALTSQFDMSLPSNQTIKIRKGTTGAYQEYAAALINKYISNPGLPTEYCHYQAFVDITDLIKQQGEGTYTVGNGAFSTGPIDDFGNYGGWGIMIVYENPALDFNSVRVYDGYQQVYSGGGVTANTITLTGLNVPSAGLASSEAKIGILGWEGDARYNGDSLKINNIGFSNALNPIDNPWNGTITNNGVHVTTKNPNYTDQMSVDIDQADIGTGYGILPDASTITLRLATADDQYFCGVVACVVKMKDPAAIKLTKTVADANNSNTVEAGEILTYTLKGKNIGAANATSIILADTLPSTVTYRSSSLTVNYSPGIIAGIKTDALSDDVAEYSAANKTVTFRLGTGANAINGGVLAPLDSFIVQFQVTVNTPSTGNVPPIINVGRLTAISSSINYVDDATASMNAGSGIVLPVILTSFTANLLENNKVKIAWTTSMEINSSRFDIERSTDGVSFKTVASKSASGNSSIPVNYFITDDVSLVTASIVYYRLKQIDIDERASISKVVPVKLKKNIGKFVVSPNPFRKNININIDWDKNETTIVKVFSVSGTEVVSKSIKMTKGFNYVSIDELSKVPAGNYIIEFNTSNGRVIKQVIKQQ